MALYKPYMNPTRLIRGFGGKRGLLISSVLLVLLLFPTIFGCYRSVDTGASAYGSTLTIDVRDIATVAAVGYSDGAKHYTIVPRDNENAIVVARITVMNPISARTSMLIDDEAAYLSDDKYNDFDALDPYIHRVETIEAVEGEDQYLPFLWGTVDLKQKYQIQGWMFFEAPVGADLNSLYWEQADTVRVRLKDS